MTFLSKKWLLSLLLILFTAYCYSVSAENRTVNLDVDYKMVNFSGKSMQAIAVNNQIPGPTLHFKQGDRVTINVHNHLKEPTSIHWHGILVPWEMDGVSSISQTPIKPNHTFQYRFTLKQSGTYWYHAHSDLQEQQGLYGALIVDSLRQNYRSNKDFIVVLSDWINTHPNKVFANLKKEGEFYSAKFPLQASLVDFLTAYKKASPSVRKKLKHAYYMMEKMRMGLYDLSDVAYDAFLLNGRTKSQSWIKRVAVGNTIRLRFINAGASTLFQIKIPHAKMQVIHVQGNDVQPYFVGSLTIAPGETYDVIIKIKKSSPYIIYAESIDKLGAAYGVLLTKNNQNFDLSAIKPFPNPKPQTMMMPPKSAKESITKYDRLKAVKKTNQSNRRQSIHTTKMMLTGFMGHYMWFINGKPEWKVKPILIQRGKRYRLIFINHSLMHHPMHIHGHWFILQNGHGAYDPLLHTIDVPPNSTVIADFDAKESGQWYFHCHNLYHMKAGMATMFRYKNAKNIPKYLAGHKPAWYAKTHMDIGGDFYREIYKGTINTLIGSDTNKFQLHVKDAEIKKGKTERANADFFYWHLIDQFWAIKGGINYTYRPSGKPYLQPGIGVEGLMPFFIETDLRTYLRKGSIKFDLQFNRHTHIYRRLFLNIGLRSIFATKTVSEDMIGHGLNEIEVEIGPHLLLSSNFSLFAEYEYLSYYGKLKQLRAKKNELDKETAFFIGGSFLF
jgi:FtsP/CotA-like multicopper oxidase with cupredoxin domain